MSQWILKKYITVSGFNNSLHIIFVEQKSINSKVLNQIWKLRDIYDLWMGYCVKLESDKQVIYSVAFIAIENYCTHCQKTTTTYT